MRQFVVSTSFCKRGQIKIKDMSKQKILQSFDKSMAEMYMQHDYRAMYEFYNKILRPHLECDECLGAKLWKENETDKEIQCPKCVKIRNQAIKCVGPLGYDAKCKDHM